MVTIIEIKRGKKGYGALLVIIIITVVLSSLVIPLVSRNKYSVQGVTGMEQKYASLNLVDSCGELSIQQYFRNGTIPAALTLSEGDCSISVQVKTSSYIEMMVSADLYEKTTTTQIIMTRFFGHWYYIWQQYQ